MMRNMAGMMKKVQEMQSRMEALQQEMADTEFSAAVGGGAVQVTVTGKGEMRGVVGSTWRIAEALPTIGWSPPTPIHPRRAERIRAPLGD